MARKKANCVHHEAVETGKVRVTIAGIVYRVRVSKKPLVQDGDRYCWRSDRDRHVIIFDPGVPPHWYPSVLAEAVSTIWQKSLGGDNAANPPELPESLPASERIGDAEFNAIMARVMKGVDHG
jgi:hypothetical protein